MGDCRIRIVIAKSLFSAIPDELTSQYDADASSRVVSNKTSVAFVSMYTADTTVREVIDENPLLKKLFFGNDDSLLSPSSTGTKIEVKSEFTLWDCTLSPPKDITSYPAQEYPDLQGPRSKTLHAAGLFPSGTWMAIPKGLSPNKFAGSDGDGDVYVDVQYNNSRAIDGSGIQQKVEFKDPTLLLNANGGSQNSVPLPSQVMESVSNRFEAEQREEELKRMEASESSTVDLRRQNQRRRAQKERDRLAKLERRIAYLEERSENDKRGKKKKTSNQVLRMLVKSRATGDKNLKEQDRFYFQCLAFVDDTCDTDGEINDQSNATTTSTDGFKPSKEYRYFSPQDTFAKIAQSFSNVKDQNSKGFYSEVLYKQPEMRKEGIQTKAPEYHRFPTTMRVYEAKSLGHLKLSESINNFFDDVLIIRWYRDRENATPLTQDREQIDRDSESHGTEKGYSDGTESTILADRTTKGAEPSVGDDRVNTDTGMTFKDAQLSDAIREMDAVINTGASKRTSAKKSSAAADKVKQMKMKAKAKGNKKLKMEDRVFLEVVSISEITSKPNCDCYFLSKKDPIERIYQMTASSTSASKPIGTDAAEKWEILIPCEDSMYRQIEDPSIRMKEAEEKDILKSFDRIIIRPKTTQS